MKDGSCLAFLQWIMPQLGLRWSGYRRVHRQVCKRLGRRLCELGLADFAAYRSYVLDHDAEWAAIDAACRITISRFYRDAALFAHLGDTVLPQLAAAAAARRETAIRAWSAGCGAGEEPYSLMLAWRLGAAAKYPTVSLEIIATDVDDGQLRRAEAGCYRPGTLRELPAEWRTRAFLLNGPLLCLRPEFRTRVEFRRQDIRADTPHGPFDLVLCRNLAFTYFDHAQQHNVLRLLLRELAPDGVLVIGRGERLPDDTTAFARAVPNRPIYRKAAATSASTSSANRLSAADTSTG